jgi:predicted dehydrogenase
VKAAILGYGLIGKERLAALRALEVEALVYDPALKTEVPGVAVLPTLDAVWAAKPDWVIVATPHHLAAGLARQALDAGAKVLLEKPLGRTVAEARALQSDRLWVGFNYRFFAGVAALLADANGGRFGKLVSAKMVLGHGGAPNMADSWKMDLDQVGGGCLLDPGIHLLDLALQLAPGLKARSGLAWRGFWNKGFDEEAQLLLDAGGFGIQVDASLVRWRSTFELEIHGSDGYGRVSGRGRSYGPQTYVRGKRWGWQNAKDQAASEELVLTSDGNDSFTRELGALLQPGAPGPRPCSAAEALKGMQLYEACLDVTGRP